MEVLHSAITHGKEINVRTGKDETRLPLFSDDMFMYLANPRKSPKLLELVESSAKF